MRVSGCSALVTGGASGLGLATARMLVAAGARVVVADLPSAGAAGAVVGIGAEFATADVTDETAMQAAVDAAVQIGPLRIAVTCAGIAPAGRVVGRSGPLPLAEFTRAVAVNLTGTFNAVRLAAAAMAAQEPVSEPEREGLPATPERGVIVMTASVAAFDGQIGQTAYAASKGGVVALTLPLARDLARSQIRAMTIAPGVMATPMTDALPDEVRAALAAEVPHPARLGTGAEYAALVRQIIENPLLNGEVIRLDGAIRMPPR